MGDFRTAVNHIFAREGGYVDHPRDPGGATNMGITRKTYAAWKGRAVSKAEVKSMTRDDASAIYKANYWDKVEGDSLPHGVALSVFDFGVNAGNSRSVRMIQKIVGTTADGKMGPVTLGEILEYPDKIELINKFAAARLKYYKGLRHWRTFGKGWARRVEAIRRASIALAKDGDLIVELEPADGGESANAYKPVRDGVDWGAVVWGILNVFTALRSKTSP